MTEQSKGLLLTALGVLAVVPDSLVVRLVSFDTIEVIGLRAFFASLVLGIGLFAVYGRSLPSRLIALGWPGLLYAALFAGTTFAFLSALRMTSVANALFIISTAPVFAAIASWLLLGEQLSRRMVITTVCALVGIGIIASGSETHAKATLAGDLVALITACALALTFVTARAARKNSMIPAAAFGYAVTALVVLTLIGWPQGSRADWTLIILLGAVFIPVGSSLLTVGPRYITAPEVSLLLLLEAVLAPLLVWLIVGEDPGPAALIGGAVVIATLAVSNIIALRRVHSK